MRNAIAITVLMLFVVGAAYAKQHEPGPSDVQTDGLLDCTNASSITCGETQTNAVGPGLGNVDTYGCTTLLYDSAMEFVYELCIGGNGGQVDIAMTYNHNSSTNDLDLFLLGSCEESDCIDASLGTTGTETISAVLSPGYYYLVVDGWGGRQDGSAHDIVVNCSAPCATPVETSTWGEIKSLHQ
jgi:hypothetical protein